MKERLTAIVGARISEFRRKMAQVRKEAKNLPRKIVVEIEARTEKFQRTLNRIANVMQSFDTVVRNTLGGLALASSPALVPIIATLVGLLGTLGPMLAVIGGSTFALATAFGFAGTATLAFGAAATPTIQALFGETKNLTKAQKEARKQFDAVGKTWKKITKDLEPKVLEAFTKSMQIANKVLQMARPLFDSSAKAVNNLLNSLNKSLDSKPVQAFFDFMNKSAGPMLETLGKASGYIMQGFMSMMTAFGPLAEKTAQGFLNMSKGFAEWAAGLSKSEGFQAFVNYILENMPKIRSIFRDAIAGLVYMFSAFAPLSSDMMSGLQDMMARFKEWAKSLGENEQFQKFIGYIRENTPKVLDLIGNLTQFIVNLGIGLAPMGSKILDIVNGFLAWTNEMMRTNPLIGQIISWVVVLAGLLIAFVPNIILFTSTFSGMGTKIMGVLKNVWTYFVPFKGAITTGLQMMGKSFGTFVLNIGKGATKIIGFIVRLAVQFLLQAARMALAWFIAMGPVGWVIAIVIGLVALIIWKWKEIKSWTIKTWDKIWNWIKDIWNKIVNWTKEAAGKVYKWAKDKIEKIQDIDLFQIGKDIIQGLIDGIGSMGQAVWDAAKGIASSVVDSITGFLGIHSPSREAIWLMKQFGAGMVVGVRKSVSNVKKAVVDLARSAVLQPQTVQLGLSTNAGSSFEMIREHFTDNEFKQQKYETVQNLEGLFKGANFNVRHEQDIEKIARQLARYINWEGRKV